MKVENICIAHNWAAVRLTGLDYSILVFRYGPNGVITKDTKFKLGSIDKHGWDLTAILSADLKKIIYLALRTELMKKGLT